MTLAEKSVERISSLATDQRPRYAEALRDSMVWDRDEDQKPASAGDLSRWHNLPLRALEAQLIVLAKSRVADLLRDVGQPMGLPSVRRTLTAHAYKRRFGRKASKVSNRLVFTYVEALELCGFYGELDPPDTLNGLLPK
jgi:hypothetical protein